MYSAPSSTDCTPEVQTVFFMAAPELGSGGWYQGKLKCYKSLPLIFRFVCLFSTLSMPLAAIAFDWIPEFQRGLFWQGFPFYTLLS